LEMNEAKKDWRRTVPVSVALTARRIADQKMMAEKLVMQEQMSEATRVLHDAHKELIKHSTELMDAVVRSVEYQDLMEKVVGELMAATDEFRERAGNYLLMEADAQEGRVSGDNAAADALESMRQASVRLVAAHEEVRKWSGQTW
jgi:cell fate (sporulation/competence/biofilm development) regulator YlbF (YheA/YmcA/DUF963 family)